MIPPAQRALRDYFPSFLQLRRLTLLFACISSFSEHIKPFSAFRYKLSSISLASCNTKGALVTLVSYFPVSHTYLSGLSYIQESERTPPLSRTFFEELRAPVGLMEDLVLFEELSKLGLCFEEVVISDFVPKPTWP